METFAPHAVNQDPASATAQVPDRRRSPRDQRHAPAWVSTAVNARGGGGINVMVDNLSLHGVGFVSPEPLKPGESHWMVIADGALRLSTRMKIVNVRPVGDKQYAIGAEFF